MQSAHTRVQWEIHSNVCIIATSLQLASPRCVDRFDQSIHISDSSELVTVPPAQLIVRNISVHPDIEAYMRSLVTALSEPLFDSFAMRVHQRQPMLTAKATTAFTRVVL